MKNGLPFIRVWIIHKRKPNDQLNYIQYYRQETPQRNNFIQYDIHILEFYHKCDSNNHSGTQSPNNTFHPQPLLNIPSIRPLLNTRIPQPLLSTSIAQLLPISLSTKSSVHRTNNNYFPSPCQLNYLFTEPTTTLHNKQSLTKKLSSPANGQSKQ